MLCSAAVYRCTENLIREYAGTQNPLKRLEPLTPRQSHMPEDLNPQHHRCKEFLNELSTAKTRCWSERFTNALRVLSSSRIHLIRETLHTHGKSFQPYEELIRTLSSLRRPTSTGPTGVLKDRPFRITS